MFRTLMTSRRFAPLFWCQFFSAFNDNFVRNMLVMLILFRFGGENASLEILLATIVFILPSIPLSALGGEIADSHDKALIARRLKFAEIFVQMIAAAGFAFASPALLYVALFGLGVIAALFGPIKYGILPDHLRREELVSGNALVEGATFAAIICGLVFGGFAAAARPLGGERGRAAHARRARLLRLASRFIPPTGVGAPGLKVHKNVLASTWTVIREVRADDRQWVGAIGTSWFWMVGAVTLSLVPVIIKSRIGGGVDVEIAINLFFAIGIAAGSLGAAAALARAHRARARALPPAGDGGAGDRHGAFDRRDADRERRNSARPILHERRGPAHRARDFRLFGRRRPVRRSDLRRGSGLGRRGPARARRRRGQRPQLHLDGRRFARDHGPAAGLHG